MKYKRQFVPGIDISYWNTYGKTSAQILDMLVSAAARNVEWCMIRAGKGGIGDSGIDLVTGRDKQLGPMWDAVSASALLPLAYWRVYDILNEDPITQATQAFEAFEYATGNQDPTPWVIDVEEFWPNNTGTEPMGIELVQHWLTTFRSTLAAMGATNVALYTRKTWWDPHVNLLWGDIPMFTAHWIRQEVPENAATWEHWAWLNMPDGPWTPSQWPNADVWQFAAVGSAYGTKIGASSADLDCNLMSISLWERLTGL